MPRRVLLVGCVLLLLAGCQTGPTKKNAYENDPLVLSKKPVEGTVHPTPSLLAARPEPMPPLLPARPDTVAGLSGVAAQPTAILKRPVSAIPAVRLTRIEPNHAPVYDHAADLSWLQGVVEKHYQGYFELRFAEASLDDRWNGKVRFEADMRLTGLQDGDVVRVEGWLVPEAGGTKPAWNQARRYKVSTVCLIRRMS